MERKGGGLADYPGLVFPLTAAFAPLVLRLWRRKRLTDSDANRRAQAWYRHIRLLARLSDTPVSQELEEIALRARFSQHTVTDEELRVLEERADALREWLLTGYPLRGVLWRILLAI